MILNEVFRDGGWLAQHIPNYKARPGQIELAQAVDTALYEGRHLLAEGPTGCHAPSQGILLYDGHVKMAKEIKVGDLLMGPDSRPREVQALARGWEEMVKVMPVKGHPWTVNRSHILTLQRTLTRPPKDHRRVDYLGETILDVCIREWENWSNTRKHIYKLFRTGVEFPVGGALPIDPYFLGVYLGDGTSAGGPIGISTADREIKESVVHQAKLWGLSLRTARKGKNKAADYYLTQGPRTGRRRSNLGKALNSLGLLYKKSGEKFVPHSYKVSSRGDRLAVLAGLLDTDGSLSCGGYDFISKSKKLADDVAFISRSLGLAAYVHPCKKTDQNGVSGKYFRVSISGDVHYIPCRIPRKRASVRGQKKSVLRTGFKIRSCRRAGRYYGFTLSGDGRYLLDDFTVTHNTGKSMAYGIPAAIYALSERTTVVIVTANITLQEQLYNKDFPLIAKVLEGKLEMEGGDVLPPLRFQLMKGMGNYLCRDKLQETHDEEKKNTGKTPEWLAEIEAWAKTTDTGDKSELPKEYDPALWAKVSANSDDCTKDECSYCDRCYMLRSRGAAGAHVIITNYHMLFTDLTIKEVTAGKAQLLPFYKTIIMDEAHEAVDIAMAFQGFEFTASKFRWLANRMMGLNDRYADTLARNLTRGADAFFAVLQKNYSQDILRKPLGQDGGLVVALKDAGEFLEDQEPEEDATEAAARTVARLRAMSKTFLKYATNVENVARGLTSISGKQVLPSGKVYYMEQDQKHGLKLCCKAVDVQPFLRTNIFNDKRLIGTSATLSTGGNFKFIASEMGLQENEYTSKIVETPFDPERMMLVVPRDIPVPKQQDQHTAAVGQVVERVANDLRGRTMALFTSYRALKAVRSYLEKRLKGVTILMQGELPKSKIIETFKRDNHYLILATQSFWQGVDIPGQALSCVVVDKFPFMPPSDPVLKYLEEKMQEEGGSAFFEYSVPKAVIALKQGVGRLIRTEEDYGVIVLCDSRLDSTSYGKQFARAFPHRDEDDTCCLRSNDGDLADVKSFLDGMEAQCKTKPSSI
jgi:ATP-dependent DNA helicase DinG